MSKIQNELAGKLFRESEKQHHRRTDLMFGVLFVLQFIGAVLAAFLLAPRTWSGSESSVHIHVWAGPVSARCSV